ncbi:hypothetical protein AB0A74_41770 [Saccharothrix sp. NPDC042600]|uniref:hypothetical protein n=1 Tax=Saccharothrix TaxID=2071 RepID=UPI0033D1E1D1|nr:ABC transporter permease [Saccharothrix mutabilis subsp. capreolus]
MIWLTWRQQRVALLVLAVYVLALIALMAFHRDAMLDHIEARAMWPCVPSRMDEACLHAMDSTTWRWQTAVENVRLAFIGYGLLVGVFLGAPLFAREFEQHTYLLALSQSVRPGRWFAVKVAFVVPAAVGALVLGGVYLWWTAPMGKTIIPPDGFHAGLFETQAPAMFGYVVFAVGLGVVAGLAVRRVVPAMAVTLAGWLSTLYVVRTFARPRYLTPVVDERPYGVPNAGYRDDGDRWRLHEGVTDLAGRFVPNTDRSVQAAADACRFSTDEPWQESALRACMAKQGYRSAADLVHPGDRFWLFQAFEATLFTALGVLCLIGASWWLRRRFRREVRVPAQID